MANRDHMTGITVDFRLVGNSGFKISEITCGNWLTHGSQVENDQRLARTALDVGITTFAPRTSMPIPRPRPCSARL
jgi:hypothetical protein